MVALSERQVIPPFERKVRSPVLIPNIEQCVDNWFGSGNKDVIAQTIRNQASVGLAILHATEVEDMLLEVNTRGLGERGRLEKRVELLPRFIQSPGENAIACRNVDVLSTFSLLYDAGWQANEPLFGRLAVGMTDSGEWGMTTLVSTEDMNLRYNVDSVYKLFQTRPFARIGNPHFEGNKPSVRTLIDGRVQVGTEAIDTLRMKTAVTIDQFMRLSSLKLDA